MSACAHNINTDPTTDHTKKHAPTSKASTRARAMTPLKAPGATPKQRGKTPTRPRRQPDGTSASERQAFTRTNDDTQPNQRRPTSKGSRMRELERAREPKHATATKGTTKFNRRHERERATICIHKRHEEVECRLPTVTSPQRARRAQKPSVSARASASAQRDAPPQPRERASRYNNTDGAQWHEHERSTRTQTHAR